MRVISNKALVCFSAVHPDAQEPLQVWRKLIEAREFARFADFRAVFNTVDMVGEFLVFNIGGNKFRIIALVQFGQQRLFVRHVLTHKEYDLWKP